MRVPADNAYQKGIHIIAHLKHGERFLVGYLRHVVGRAPCEELLHAFTVSFECVRNIPKNTVRITDIAQKNQIVLTQSRTMPAGPHVLAL